MIKNQSLRKIFLLVLCCFLFWMQSYAEASFSSLSTPKAEPISQFMRNIVTASEYCDFLNHVASSDVNNLYNEKMGTDQSIASIIRTGAPGKYYYEVIKGRENTPISFINENAALCYISWTEENLSSHFLDASVSNNFNILEVITPIVELGLIERSTSLRDKNNNTDILSEVVIGLVAAIMIKEGTTTREGVLPSQQQPVSIDSFRTAIETYPTATRFILIEEGGRTLIQPQENIAGASGKNRSDNMRITKALKEALLQQHTEAEINRTLFQPQQLTFAYNELSSASIKDILSKSDSIKSQKQENQKKSARILEIQSNFAKGAYQKQEDNCRLAETKLTQVIEEETSRVERFQRAKEEAEKCNKKAADDFIKIQEVERANSEALQAESDLLVRLGTGNPAAQYSIGHFMAKKAYAHALDASKLKEQHMQSTREYEEQTRIATEENRKAQFQAEQKIREAKKEVLATQIERERYRKFFESTLNATEPQDLGEAANAAVENSHLGLEFIFKAVIDLLKDNINETKYVRERVDMLERQREAGALQNDHAQEDVASEKEDTPLQNTTIARTSGKKISPSISEFHDTQEAISSKLADIKKDLIYVTDQYQTAKQQRYNKQATIWKKAIDQYEIAKTNCENRRPIYREKDYAEANNLDDIIMFARAAGGNFARSAEYSQYAVEAKDEELAKLWNQASKQSQAAAEGFSITLKAEDQQRSNILREAAKEYQTASENYVQAARSRNAGDLEQEGHWKDLARSPQMAAESIVLKGKTFAASAAGNHKEASFLAQAAIQAQHASENYARAIQAWTSNHKEKIPYWNAAAKDAYIAAEKFSEAAKYISEANKENDKKSASLWMEAATQTKITAEHYVTEVIKSQYIAEQGLGSSNFTKHDIRQEAIFDNYNSTYIAKKFAEAAEYTSKSKKAESKTNSLTAYLFAQVAKESEIIAKNRLLLMELYQEGNQEHINDLEEITTCAESAYEKFVQAVTSYEQSLLPKTQFIKGEASYLESIVKYAQPAAENFERTREYKDKLLKEYQQEENQQNITFFNEVSKSSNIAAEYFSQATQLHTYGMSAEAERYYKAGNLVQLGVNQFIENYLLYSSNLQKASVANHQEEMELWKKMMEHAKLIVENKIKESNGIIANNGDQIQLWKTEANNIQKVIDSLINIFPSYTTKISEAQEAGRDEEVSFWNLFIRYTQVAIENKINAIQDGVKSADFNKKATDAQNIACKYQKSAEYARKKLVTEAAKKPEEMNYWSKVLIENQEVIKYELKIAQEVETPNKEPLYFFKKIVESAELAEKSYEKAALANESSNNEAAKKWEQAAKWAQEAEHYFAQAIQKDLPINQEVSCIDESVANITLNAIRKFLSNSHSIDDKKNEPPIHEDAENWIDRVELAYPILNNEIQAAKASALGNKEDAAHFNEIATLLEDALKHVNQNKTYRKKASDYGYNRKEHKYWMYASNYEQMIAKNITTASQLKEARNNVEAERYRTAAYSIKRIADNFVRTLSSCFQQIKWDRSLEERAYDYYIIANNRNIEAVQSSITEDTQKISLLKKLAMLAQTTEECFIKAAECKYKYDIARYYIAETRTLSDLWKEAHDKYIQLADFLMSAQKEADHLLQLSYHSNQEIMEILENLNSGSIDMNLSRAKDAMKTADITQRNFYLQRARERFNSYLRTNGEESFTFELNKTRMLQSEETNRDNIIFSELSRNLQLSRNLLDITETELWKTIIKLLETPGFSYTLYHRDAANYFTYAAIFLKMAKYDPTKENITKKAFKIATIFQYADPKWSSSFYCEKIEKEAAELEELLAKEGIVPYENDEGRSELSFRKSRY